MSTHTWGVSQHTLAHVYARLEARTRTQAPCRHNTLCSLANTNPNVTAQLRSKTSKRATGAAVGVAPTSDVSGREDEECIKKKGTKKTKIKENEKPQRANPYLMNMSQLYRYTCQSQRSVGAVVPILQLATNLHVSGPIKAWGILQGWIVPVKEKPKLVSFNTIRDLYSQGAETRISPAGSGADRYKYVLIFLTVYSSRCLEHDDKAKFQQSRSQLLKRSSSTSTHACIRHFFF